MSPTRIRILLGVAKEAAAKASSMGMPYKGVELLLLEAQQKEDADERLTYVQAARSAAEVFLCVSFYAANGVECVEAKRKVHQACIDVHHECMPSHHGLNLKAWATQGRR